jgi:hypothetical protein
MSGGGRQTGVRWQRIALAVIFATPACSAGADAFWLERWSPRDGHRWLGVAADRRAEAVDLADGAVAAERAGTLSDADVRALADASRKALAVPEPRPGGPIPEGDILRLGGRLDGARVARSWRPDQPGMDDARALAATAGRVTNALPRAATGARIRAGDVDAQRAAQLRKDGRLPFRPRADAERIPALARALAEPGWLVAAPADEAAAFRALAAGGRQLFVSDGATFDVELLSPDVKPRSAKEETR